MIRLSFLLISILCVSGCSNEVADRMQSGKELGLFGLSGRWVGPVVPATTECGSTSTGLMTIGGGTFAFDPFQSTTVINGTVSDANALEGTLSRPGANQQVLSISFSGTATDHDGADKTIDGRLVSGRCSWTVTLKRG